VRPRTPFATLIVLTLLASACAGARGSSGPDQGTSSTIGATAPQGPSASGAEDPAGATTGAQGGTPDAVPVPEILRFQTLLVGGGTLRGAELAGAPVALWFWAPW
jgi:hypothetical protein